MAIQIRGLNKSFTTADGGTLSVLRDIELEIADAQFCSLIGLSGCGKSTLLNVLGGLLAPSSGTALVNGAPARVADPRIAYMFQNDTLLPWATALENVRLPMQAVGRKDDGEAERLMDLVGLSGFERAFPGKLSGGMRKRVQLARLLAQEPEVYLLDEPFGALDAHTKILMQEEFLRLWEQDRKTVVFVTHDLYEAITMSDRVVLLAKGDRSVKASFSVDLPRPRDVNRVMSDRRYNELFKEIWTALRSDE